MAHVYSVTGEKISLTLSPNDIGVRFELPDAAAKAFIDLRANRQNIGEGEPSPKAPRYFERTLLPLCFQ